MTREYDDMEHNNMPTLSDADAYMLDRLVDAEFDPAKINDLDQADQARLDRIVSILGLLDSYPAGELSSDDRDTLVNATLTRIDLAEEERTDQMRLEPGSGFTSKLGVPELIAVAAIIMIGMSIIFPMLKATRDSSTHSIHRNNLAQIGGAFFNHADEHEGILAHTNAPEWDTLFGESTNRLDMQPLVDNGYLHTGMTGECDPLWSYQTQPRTHLFTNSMPTRTVLMGNRNPYMTQEVVSRFSYESDDGNFSAVLSVVDYQIWSPSVLMSDNSVSDITGHTYEGDDMRIPNRRCRLLEHADVFLTHPLAH